MAEIDLPFDPANFVKKITDPNPFFPLERGNRWEYEDSEGASNTVKVAGTKKILGVKCIVVKDDERDEEGKLTEKTKDYFAQDTDGNVWYFGEDSKAFLEGGGFTTEGSWRAGVDGAVPGLIMLANPQVGDTYDTEGAPGVAEDRSEVLSLTESVTVPFGSFTNCRQIAETNPLEPGSLEHTFFASGVGEVFAEDFAEGVQSELVSFRTKSGGSVNLAQLTQAMASFGQPQSGTATALASNGTDDTGLHGTLTASMGAG